MLEQARIFIKVVEFGSFSKAGRVLNMAASSIARNIDGLEKKLNTPLFRRSTRQLSLTDEGRYFFDHACKLVEDADNLILTMSQHNDKPCGVLRISVFESFGSLCISPLLPEFLSRYPQVRIEIELDNRVVDLNKENVDLAIRIGIPADSTLHARRLMTNRTLLCAAPDYLAKYGTPEKPDDIPHHNCLILGNSRQRNYWYFDQSHQHIKIPVQGNLTSKGGTPLLAAAVGGAGILLLSCWMLTQYIEANQLQVCLPDWRISHNEEGSGEIFIVYKGNKYLKPAVRAFIDFLVEKTGE